LKGLGRGRIYVNVKHPPFIYMPTDKSYLIINYKDPKQTVELYTAIKEKLDKAR
jgi:hypothetical protein